MSRLEYLRQSVGDMTEDQLREKLGQVREDRKISKHAITVTKAREKNASDKFKKAYQNLTPEEQAELLALLENDNAGDNP